MSDVLEQLAAAARRRVDACMEQVPAARMREQAEALAAEQAASSAPAFPFEAALAAPGLSFVCECKKASPSKGLIATGDYRPAEIAADYEHAGAAAISVLTEPERFLGCDEDLRQVAAAVDVPVLRKDFVVSDYQICQARVLGARAVLLICALLSPRQLQDYLACAHGLGLSALVEAHDAEEVRQAAAAGARVLGVNNRNLRDFSVDFSNSVRLRQAAPADVLFVAESGVRGPDDVAQLKRAGVDAVLVGEALMRAADKRAALQALLGGAA